MMLKPPLPAAGLRQLDSREQLLARVERELRALEDLCGTMERALMHKRWNDLDRAIADSRRITHALQNAMDDASAVRDAKFDEQVDRRVRYVHAIRQNQMARLQQFNLSVAQRLQLLGRWKSALRSMAGPRRAVSRLASLDQLT
jgi:hypothetical protein